MEDGGRKTEYKMTQPPSEGPLPVLWAVVITMALLIGAGIIEIAVDKLLYGQFTAGFPNVRVLLEQSAFYMAVLLLTVASIASLRGYNFAGYTNIYPVRPRSLLGWLLLFWTALGASVAGASFLFDANFYALISETSVLAGEPQPFTEHPVLFPAMFLHYAVVLPVLQEVLLRGFLYKSFEVHLNSPWFVILATGPTTALFYLLGLPVSLPLVLIWGVCGTLLSICRHYTSSLWPGLIAHLSVMWVAWGTAGIELLA